MMSRRCSKVFFFPLFPFLFKNLEHQVRFDPRFRGEGIVLPMKFFWFFWCTVDGRGLFSIMIVTQTVRNLYICSSSWYIYIYYNFGYIVKFHLVGFCRKRFVVESFDRSRVRVWMQSWKFFVTGRIDVVGVFFLPPEMQEQPGVPVFRQARENFTSNSKQRGQYLLCSK